MDLSMVVYDRNGATRGQVKMNLDFGSTRWSIAQDPARLWPRIVAADSGAMEVKGLQVGLKNQVAGKLPEMVMLLSNIPENGTANAGTGKIVKSSDQALADGWVYWASDEPPLSPIRQAMKAVLQEYIPKTVISSDDPLFKKLTGFDTQKLLDNFWEPENKKPAWPKGEAPAKNTTFTCCNLTLGCLANLVGARVGKKVGRWLAAGVLQLDWANKDVPGSWIPASSGGRPRVGDFYSVAHGSQVFGHVGTIGEITQQGTWVAYDGGQGGYVSANKKDYIKKVPRGKLEPSKMNGWVDIDKYFA